MSQYSGPEIHFWYEFASTYSYPAAFRIEEEARKSGVKVHWQPFLLGPIFAEQGWTTSPFNLQPKKGRYMWRDLTRLCQSYGLEFTRPKIFPQHSLLATRVAQCIDTPEIRKKFSMEVYRAQFIAGKDIADRTLLIKLLEPLVKDPRAILEAAVEPENKLAVRSSVDRAEALGIFGAPSFVTSDGELFWGNDRLNAAVEWALQHPTIQSGEN